MPTTSDLVPLLIHGFLDSGAVWAPLIDALGAFSERALAPDFAGAGTRSREGGPFTLLLAASVADQGVQPYRRAKLLGRDGLAAL